MNLYDLNDLTRDMIICECFDKYGELVTKKSGMCGDIYIFKQENSDFCVCAKVPKKFREDYSAAKINSLFISEMQNQLNYYHDNFVNWAFDFHTILDTPIALFRYWGPDLSSIIIQGNVTELRAISLLLYISLGLRHCYNNGLICHQDLKPQNIFLQDLNLSYSDLPKIDIYMLPKIGDFGLSNAFINQGIFDGSRPYMAPEQWAKETLSQKTDIFALGVIFYELLSNGYHPIGIKLHEFWPSPIDGNKKWTRSNAWSKWIKGGCQITFESETTEKHKQLLSSMLTPNPNNRIDIDSLINECLGYIEKIDFYAYQCICTMLQHFTTLKLNLPLAEKWPYLNGRWTDLQLNFKT